MFLTEQSPEELHREREELKKTLIRKVTWPASRIFALHLDYINKVIKYNILCFCPEKMATSDFSTVDVTDRFTYLGGDISSCGHSAPEMFRRIGLASSVMGQLTSVWRQSRLSMYTKLRLYNVIVVSILLYGAETWTLNKI